jgi:hypothetical protein
VWYGVCVLDVFGEEGVDGPGDGTEGEGLEQEGVGAAQVTRTYT